MLFLFFCGNCGALLLTYFILTSARSPSARSLHYRDNGAEARVAEAKTKNKTKSHLALSIQNICSMCLK
jgi:hypothetical protein